MEVILMSDVRGSGKKGDVVNVADGYAKNYLFPKNMAIEATNGALNELKNEKESCKRKKEMEKQEALKAADILKDKQVVVFSNAGESGKLFGSVTSQEIAEKINETYGLSVNKKKIRLNEDIKSFGTYEFVIKLYPEITVNMSVVVSPEK